jgi:glucokinase
MSRPATSGDVAVALDIGGTAIKAAAINRDGELFALERQPTPSQSPPDEVAALVVETVRRLLVQLGSDESAIAGVGVSMAAFVTAEGMITATAHLSPAWVGFDLGRRLATDLHSAYYFALDTFAATLGEAHFGAGRDVEDFAYVTVSTGIGAGVYARGRLYTGGLGWAGGIGHIVVEPNGPRTCDACGNRGCLETYAAKQGVLALAGEAIRRHPDSLLARASSTVLTPQMVYEAARDGDEAAICVFQQAGLHLGLGLTSLINLISPRRVVIGGGIALAGDLLLEPARRVVKQTAYPPLHRSVEIVQSELGDLSGAYGVAAMVFHDIRINLAEVQDAA